MDKASIVGDATRYIQDFQRQARDLKSEIATIEATKNPKMSSQNSNKHLVSNPFPISKRVMVIGFDINLLNLKLWLSSAFLNQGFEFNTLPSP
ncbi:putative transcription factor bHLH family [Helianthus anomalus]